MLTFVSLEIEVNSEVGEAVLVIPVDFMCVLHQYLLAPSQQSRFMACNESFAGAGDLVFFAPSPTCERGF